MSICDKCVHREVCCDEGMGEEALKFCANLLEERPKGKWIEGELDGMLLGLVPYYWYNCSECGYHFSLNRGSKKPNYCQECGADMRGDV